MNTTCLHSAVLICMFFSIMQANIGRILAHELDRAGIRSIAALKRTGSIRAALKVAERGKLDCHSMLCAIEGAIRGVRWHLIPVAERKSLMKEFDSLLRSKQRA